MTEKRNPHDELLLNEILATPKTIWWLMGLIAVSAFVGALSGAKEFDWIVLIIAVAAIAVFGLTVLLEYFLFMRRMRLYMDKTRVWMHIPLTKDRSLDWAAIRTAAIVRLGNYPAMIVLSIHDPQEALTRERMVWKNPQRGEELRFHLTDSRRAVVEQCLHMQLPEITL